MLVKFKKKKTKYDTRYLLGKKAKFEKAYLNFYIFLCTNIMVLFGNYFIYFLIWPYSGSQYLFP